MNDMLINRQALKRYVHSLGKRHARSFPFVVNECVKKLIAETCTHEKSKTVRMLQRALFVIVFIASITSVLQGETMIDANKLKEAIAIKENGGWTWRGDHYGRHQVTLILARDHALQVHGIRAMSETQARQYLIENYDRIVDWRIQQVIHDSAWFVHNVGVRAGVMHAARCWKYGTKGALRGKGIADPYCEHVANLYESLTNGGGK